MQNIDTYKDLKDAVALWLNRRDQVTLENIPNFINFAEKQFTRLVKLPYYEVLTPFTIQAGMPYIVIPQDLLAVKLITVNGVPYNRFGVEAFKRIESGEKVLTLAGGFESTTNIKAFTRIGERIYFYPAVKEGDNVELIYSQDIPEMQFDNDQPYSLLIAPDILLYLSLRHAALFLRDPEMEQFWMAKSQDAATALTQQLEDANWSGSSGVVPAFSS